MCGHRSSSHLYAAYPNLAHLLVTLSNRSSQYQGRGWHMRMMLDICNQTLRTLWAHKLRSFLTMFGIAWGVGSLLLLVGVGEGFRSGNRREMSTLGNDVMFIFPGRAPSVEGSFVGMRQYLLTYQDYVDILKA